MITHEATADLNVSDKNHTPKIFYKNLAVMFAKQLNPEMIEANS
jgi:hypothetical protein